MSSGLYRIIDHHNRKRGCIDRYFGSYDQAYQYLWLLIEGDYEHTHKYNNKGEYIKLWYNK